MTVAGALVVPPRFEQASDFRDGRARVWIAGKYGFIDNRGELVVPAKFESAEDFSDGLAQVRADGRAFFIDRRGDTVLQPARAAAWASSTSRAAG
jgi:hypothetical protein